MENNKTIINEMFFKKIIKYLPLVLIVAALLYSYKCAKGNDFLSYYDVGLAFRQLLDNIYIPGKYSGMRNHYPPVFAMIMVVFTFFHPLVAGIIFYLLKLMCVIITVKMLYEIFEVKVIPMPAIWLAFLMSFRFILDDFKLGQVNVFLVCFIIFALYYKKRENILLSSLFLSFAISIKLFPALFLFYYFIKREYKYAGICILTILILNVLPAIFYLNRYPQLLYHFVKESILNAAGDPNSGIANQSLYGMLMRFLGRNGTDIKEIAFVNFANLQFATIKIIYYVISIFFIVLAFAPALKKDRTMELFEFGNIFLVALILPMVARKSNFVFVFFPALVYFTNMFYKRDFRSLSSILIWVAFILLGFTADGIVGRKISNILEAFSNIFFGAILIFVANCIKIFSSRFNISKDKLKNIKNEGEMFAKNWKK